jgi:DNA gyrase subunit A
MAEEEKKELTTEITETIYGKLKATPIISEMEKSYLDYAMSVIVSRALPDVRDGLKPVHRRILYAMHKVGIKHSSHHKKCARIVGDVLGKYHPHGDSSVYLALVRLAQSFSMRYPLVDGQGNFGSVDGDSPAAMRYTEARLAKISEEILTDLDKETVDYTDNFDGSLKEPTVLPGKLPNLLLMGSEGIAVGMATKIPPHNLNEVCSAIIAMVDNSNVEENHDSKISLDDLKDKEALMKNHELINYLANKDPKILAGEFKTTVDASQIMEHIKGPDFPTGGTIFNVEAIKKAYQEGRGRILIQAKTKIVEGKKGSWKILVTEIPYQVNKAKLIIKIADLVRAKRIVGIKDLNDDSDRKGMQITIELKKDANPQVVLNKLYKYTELQTGFSMNMVALNSEGVPQLMSIKHVLKEYVQHRQLVVVKKTQYELKEVVDRAHILEGLLIALNNLDEVIETIRRSKDTPTASEALITKFALSERQATAILDMQLKRLAALERQKIEDEYEEIKNKIEHFINLLVDKKKIMAVLKAQTLELIEKYGDKRKTQVKRNNPGEINEEDLIPEGDAVITLTKSGYIKRMNPASFRAQSRGGKGASGVKMKNSDFLQDILIANTHDDLLLFTNSGKVFKLKTYQLPEASKQAKGTAAVNLVNLSSQERIQSIVILPKDKDLSGRFVCLVTKKGLVKKTKIELYNNIRLTGIIGINLNSGDELVWGGITNGRNDLILITHFGKCIRFHENEIKASSRDTKGVKGIILAKEDEVINAENIKDDTDQNTSYLLMITEKGLGKKTKFKNYPVQKRSGMGLKVAAINDKTGKVAQAVFVNDKCQEIIISTRLGQTIKMPFDEKVIPTLSRTTQGVIMIRTKKNDTVVSLTTIYDQKEEVKEEVKEGEKKEEKKK